MQHPRRAMAAWFDVEVSRPELLVLALPDATIAGRAVYANDERPAANVRIRVDDFAGESRAFIARADPAGGARWGPREGQRLVPAGRITTAPEHLPLRRRGDGRGAEDPDIDGEFVRSQTIVGPRSRPARSPRTCRGEGLRVRRAGSIDRPGRESAPPPPGASHDPGGPSRRSRPPAEAAGSRVATEAVNASTEWSLGAVPRERRRERRRRVPRGRRPGDRGRVRTSLGWICGSSDPGAQILSDPPRAAEGSRRRGPRALHGRSRGTGRGRWRGVEPAPIGGRDLTSGVREPRIGGVGRLGLEAVHGVGAARPDSRAASMAARSTTAARRAVFTTVATGAAVRGALRRPSSPRVSSVIEPRAGRRRQHRLRARARSGVEVLGIARRGWRR